MPNLGGWELIVLLGVLVLLFGATKLPSAARAIGQSMRILKAETKGMRSEDEATPPAPPQQAPQQVLPPSSPTATPVQEPTAVHESTAVQKSQRPNDTTR
ncbi:MAG TPA: Sec-independent protein translocase subunit TatA [Pseudonocardiaceae bacterium]|jgi:sec-independent protein translocase protein TatA|nr:Sec-independent protein translocase subunit TatA [Pseudonocardiaceae bacterium]